MWGASAAKLESNLPRTRAGFGGPKRLRKQNDAASAADVDGYRPSRFDDGVAAKFGGGGGGRGGELLCPLASFWGCIVL